MGIKKLIFSNLFVFLIFSSTFATGSEKGGAMSDHNKLSVDFLSQERIFFGHQSVGENILSGIEKVSPEFKNHIYDMKNLSIKDYSKFGLFHSRVGNNNDPKSKISEFDRIIRERFKGKLDVAFIKLCYVDFNKNTNLEELFSFYKRTMTQLRQDYPDVKFVHFTIPLIRNSETWKTKIKKIIGFGDLWEYGNNVIRNKYSRMIHDEYGGKEPVFDIAKFESTTADGQRVSFLLDGETYYALADELTSDGGHLNDQGRRLVATELLNHLSSL